MPDTRALVTAFREKRDIEINVPRGRGALISTIGAVPLGIGLVYLLVALASPGGGKHLTLATAGIVVGLVLGCIGVVFAVRDG